jgi:predicted Zn-dependent protease with MMP-like domain
MRPRRRMSWHEFCDTVREAVESLPAEFHRYLENVAVDVEEEPGEVDYAALDDREVEDDGLLLGVFHGVPLTEQSYGIPHPNVIRIFRRPLEEVTRTRRGLIRQIRATVIHELAHHFGFSEEELTAFERAQEAMESREKSSPDD